MTDENRKCSAAAEMTSSSKVPNKTRHGSTDISPDATVASTAFADGCRKKPAMVVEQQGNRPKSPRGASAAGTARCGTHPHHHDHHQQQQHLSKAAELLKRVAEKQLTGSTLTERLLVAKLTALPTTESHSNEKTAKKDIAMELTAVNMSRDSATVTKTSPCIATDDVLIVIKPDKVEDVCGAESARRDSSRLNENRTRSGDYAVSLVDNVTSERQSNLVSALITDEPIDQPKVYTAAESMERTVNFQQREVDNQDDSDLRTVSLKRTNFLSFCNPYSQHDTTALY